MFAIENSLKKIVGKMFVLSTKYDDFFYDILNASLDLLFSSQVKKVSKKPLVAIRGISCWELYHIQIRCILDLPFTLLSRWRHSKYKFYKKNPLVKSGVFVVEMYS